MDAALLRAASKQAKNQVALQAQYFEQRQGYYEAVHINNAIRQQMTNAALRMTALGAEEELPLVADAIEQLATEIPSGITSTDDEAARHAIFAVWESPDYLPARQYIESELITRPGFDSLSRPQKIHELAVVIVQSDSPLVVTCGMSLLMNWITDLVPIRNVWLLLLLAIALLIANRISPKQRVATIQRFARDGGTADPARCVVSHTCCVFSAPRPKANKIGSADPGTIVRVDSRATGWRKVQVLSGNALGCIGWVRSKYIEPL
jgi:hypothetical protein